MSIINDFLSLIYPRRCEACRDNMYGHERFLCNYCRLNLPKPDVDSENNALEQVFAGRVPLSGIYSCYVYEKSGKVQRLIHAIKYQDQKELAEYLGEMYANELLQNEAMKEIELILPVPLHRKKLNERGFNQSEWFAKGLAAVLKKPLDLFSLERNRETSTQTRKKKYQRWENVEGMFTLKGKDALSGCHVLLVDDVITTGATIEAAWLALKEADGIKVSVASIAFAQRGY